jgi:hypothetical protein
MGSILLQAISDSRPDDRVVEIVRHNSNPIVSKAELETLDRVPDEKPGQAHREEDSADPPRDDADENPRPSLISMVLEIDHTASAFVSPQRHRNMAIRACFAGWAVENTQSCSWMGIPDAPIATDTCIGID